MRWVTRTDIKVGRVACPWLIRRFIDAHAEFLFAPEDRLLEIARREGAIPFDAARFPEVQLNHRGKRCAFDILEDYRLNDPALRRLAFMVRGEDVKGQEHIAAEGLGLRAIAQGFALPGISDEERLRRNTRSTTRCMNTPSEVQQAVARLISGSSNSNTRRFVTCLV
jgi:hypothetical protein